MSDSMIFSRGWGRRDGEAMYVGIQSLTVSVAAQK
jgi:hypothetical protein